MVQFPPTGAVEQVLTPVWTIVCCDFTSFTWPFTTVEVSVTTVLLLVLRDGFPAARLPLPPAVDGHIQLIEAADSPAVAALRDPTTELLLV